MIVFTVAVSQTAFADTPTPISILIEEKITVGDGSTPSGEVIEESVSVNDEVTTSGEVISESVSVTDEVTTSGEVIKESITVTDTVETELSALLTPTAVPKKPAKRETIVPATTKKPTIASILPKANRPAEAEKPRKEDSSSEPTPARKGSRLIGRGMGAEPGSGPCNSPSGYQGLSLLSTLLIPGLLKLGKKRR